RVPLWVAGGAQHVVTPRRTVLDEGEERTSPVRHEALPHAREQAQERHARVLGARMLGEVVRVEGEQVDHLSALEIDHAEQPAGAHAHGPTLTGRDADGALRQRSRARYHPAEITVGTAS